MAAFSEREVRYLLDLSRRFAVGSVESSAKHRKLLAGLCRLVSAETGTCALLREDFSIVGDVTFVRRGAGCGDQANFSAYNAPLHGDGNHAGNHPASAENPLLQPTFQEALRHYLSSAPSAANEAPHERLRHGSRFFGRFLARLGLDDCILSVVPLPRLKPFMAAVCLSRPLRTNGSEAGTDESTRFTPRQRRAVHVAHKGLRWIYYPETPPTEQAMSASLEYVCPLRSPATELAPRYQRVLNHLLAGGSEKALADQLGLSRHTIHEYVRAIYRTFNVNSRSELMAYWVEA